MRGREGGREGEEEEGKREGDAREGGKVKEGRTGDDIYFKAFQHWIDGRSHHVTEHQCCVNQRCAAGVRMAFMNVYTHQLLEASLNSEAPQNPESRFMCSVSPRISLPVFCPAVHRRGQRPDRKV